MYPGVINSSEDWRSAIFEVNCIYCKYIFRVGSNEIENRSSETACVFYESTSDDTTVGDLIIAGFTDCAEAENSANIKENEPRHFV